VGRLGLFEMMPADAALSRLIADGAEEGEVVEEMRRRGVARLVDDAMEKLAVGDTTVADVLRAVTVW
jgi:type II secretory ATPase GspE/PulE/Tfp pilus assembly ATPase PilB-like protein